jgi:hypothetical protein
MAKVNSNKIKWQNENTYHVEVGDGIQSGIKE